MFVVGQWMGVCNDGFDVQDAHVVCRQLGLGHAAVLVNADTDHLSKTADYYRDLDTYNR